MKRCRHGGVIGTAKPSPIKPACKDDQSPFLTALHPKENLPRTYEFQKVYLPDKFILF
ncbi:hypothetical protein MTR_2g075460 [Medicago truncatula]|uniref:Uncharacterized protein n=1 Tax=Medicago truncatula TaxID=3880 RepID=G7IR10_MEDTR|nr:hypothetical protein MTR_2g075460 [Medicago truncatula]